MAFQIITTKEGETIFIKEGEQTFLHQRGNKHFCIEDGYDNVNVDVKEEMDVSEANILVSEASKLSALARILQGVSEKSVHLCFCNFSASKTPRKVVLYIFQQLYLCRIQK